MGRACKKLENHFLKPTQKGHAAKTQPKPKTEMASSSSGAAASSSKEPIDVSAESEKGTTGVLSWEKKKALIQIFLGDNFEEAEVRKV